VSEHSIDIDVQVLAVEIQNIRASCDRVEEIIQGALLKENNVRDNSSTNSQS